VNKIRLSDRIAEQLQGMIAEGVLKAGERLPPERQLAERLGVSRPSVREAIQKLGSKGLVVTRHGGGSFVAARLETAFTDPLIALIRERGDAEFDTLQVRMELEAMAAGLAATRATDADRECIEAAFEHMARVQRSDCDAVTKLNADIAFHLSITEASHNIVVTHLMRAVMTVLEASIGEYLDLFYAKPVFVERITAQHRVMVDAIMARDPDAARAAARGHLEFSFASYREFQAEARFSHNSRLYTAIYGDKK
jgi:GntR family transcriptional repressor for pyruvate dehydrogenase complex/GntR family L-lactate dehydrogenase operon transcriptional regulator